MKPSKLQHMDILKVLAHYGPLKLTQVMHRANVNSGYLKEHLDFLLERKLIDVRTVGRSATAYAITQRGIAVLKNFKEFRQILPAT